MIIASASIPVTINLVTGLVLIMVLENIIRKRGLLKRMMEAVVNVARDRRIAMAVLPGVIGLLPSAGGAAFSAPMVQEAAADVDIAPEHKAFINYWFRHIWEYCSPLYPGVVLAAAVTKMPLNKFLLSQLPLPLAVVGVGALLGFRGSEHEPVAGKRDRNEMKTLFLTLLPITAPVVLVVVFKLPLAVAMISIVVVHVPVLPLLARGNCDHPPGKLFPEHHAHDRRHHGVQGHARSDRRHRSPARLLQAERAADRRVFFALPFIVGLLTGLTVGSSAPPSRSSWP